MNNAILLDEREAARALSMTPNRLSRLARKGIVPHILLPDGEIRFREADLREWVEQYHRPARAPAEVAS